MHSLFSNILTSTQRVYAQAHKVPENPFDHVKDGRIWSADNRGSYSPETARSIAADIRRDARGHTPEDAAKLRAEADRICALADEAEAYRRA